MIGIICAMSIEGENILSLMKDCKKETVSGMEFTSGTLGGKKLVVAICGIGKVFAAMCAQTMILRYAPDKLINVGVAGSLSTSLQICDIAVSESVVQHDMDTSPLGDPLGLISGINLVKLAADETLVASVLSCCKALSLSAKKGVIASGDQFLCDPAKKAAIASEFGAIACEMEGAAIGQVCYVNKVPFVILRAISDSADGSSHLDYNIFKVKAAANSANVIAKLLQDCDI